MNSGSSAAAATQPTGIVPPGAYPPAPPMVHPGNMKLPSYPEEDVKREWEPEFRETFSVNTLKLRIREYQGGKYTQRYIQTYLEFMVLSGMVDNLQYLEFKRVISGEQE